MAKTIHIELSNRGIADAIKQLENYKRDFLKKAETFRKRICERIKEEAISNFANAVCDDIVGGGTRHASVEISVEPGGGDSVMLVIARGEDAVFCEFGAGVTHNTPAGSSPHPNGETLGLTIGSFGKGFGSRKVWGYYDENDQLVLTRGTPASMPMYNAMKTVCSEISEIAKEVFS